MTDTPYPRDMVGYGRNRPHPHWPGEARIAVQFVINYEEGAENTVLHGDAGSETLLTEFGFVEPRVGERALPIESHVRVRQPRRLLAPPSAQRRCSPLLVGERALTERGSAGHDFRRRHGARPQSRGGGRHGGGGLGDREPRLSLDRLSHRARGRGARAHREGHRAPAGAHRHAPARLLPRPPQSQYGAPGGGGGGLPLQPGFLCRRVALLGGGSRPPPADDPLHGGPQRSPLRHRAGLRLG